MGNCIRKGSFAEWGGDDWGSLGSGDKNRTGENLYGRSSVQESSLLGEKDGVSSGSLAQGTEVKIKISKKQLEKLLKEADIEGLSVQQVLAKLNDGSHRFEAHRRSWRPALQSIAE
ncbi:hypothetical protein CDL12_16224 [Handroanthus impetiginosus]|uniref:Uncharacterized protein n=1 Tax=Handroanthus impetiginosus TaxID=429701 RepID=A0A2G9H104_9LAMI|nr:hypothetical protein CDL12_16224 [Handroanthus impetiginosus]